MSPTTDEQLARLVEQLRRNPGLAHTLSGDQGEIVQDALDGKKLYDIANDRRVPEAYLPPDQRGVSDAFRRWAMPLLGRNPFPDYLRLVANGKSVRN